MKMKTKEIEISKEVKEFIDKEKREGETNDDVILRKATEYDEGLIKVRLVNKEILKIKDYIEYFNDDGSWIFLGGVYNLKDKTFHPLKDLMKTEMEDLIRIKNENKKDKII